MTQLKSEFWKNHRVLVTGGAGFLGSFIVEKIEDLGAIDVIVPRIEDYDLRDIVDIRRIFDDVTNSSNDSLSDLIIIHLAALAGGIGANRARPAEFFYDNLMMGVPLMHEA